MPTIGYARVSGHDQKNDLVRQQELLEAFCAARGWRNEIIADLGSGLNTRQKGLNHVLELILRKRIRQLVLTHKDRLLRFGSEFRSGRWARRCYGLRAKPIRAKPARRQSSRRFRPIRATASLWERPHISSHPTRLAARRRLLLRLR